MALYLYCLLAIVGIGLYIGISKSVAGKIPPQNFIFWRQLNTSIVFLILTVLVHGVENINLADNSSNYLQLIGVSVIGYGGLISFYKALEYGKVSVMSTLIQFNVVVSLIMGYLIWGDDINLWHILVGLILVFGVYTIGGAEKIKLDKAIIYLLLATLFWGFAFRAYGAFVQGIGLFPSLFIISVVSLFCSAVFIALTNRDFSMPRNVIKNIWMVSNFEILAGIGNNLAVDAGGALALGIIGANPVVTIIYSRFAYGEKLNLKAIGGILIVIASAILIAIV